MSHLLVKLGKDALKPSKIGNTWHKAALSAKNVARLRKEVLRSGSVWEYDDESAKKQVPREPKPRKGHKHDRLKVELEKERARKMANMDATIQDYRNRKRENNASLIDRMTLTKKQLRAKMRNVT